MRIHLRKKKRDPAHFDLDALVKASQGYSGAEIEQAIISSLYDAFIENRDIRTEDVLRTIKQSIPLSVTMKESISQLREWAHDRARCSSSEQKDEACKPGRKLEFEK
jgi:SpoVK/Ycf46/Vps4 family AAA+-type ATPase